jgi:hypothetical protein
VRTRGRVELAGRGIGRELSILSKPLRLIFVGMTFVTTFMTASLVD